MRIKNRITKTVVLAFILIVCVTSATGCFYNAIFGTKEIEPRAVVLELINPITGEAVQNDETIDLPEEGTPIVVRIKDKETGRYLTDDDLPENSIQGSSHVNFIFLDKEGNVRRREYYKNWPAQKDIDDLPYCNYYEMMMDFDCRPEKPKDPKKFQRRYESKTSYVRFYINKPWKENDRV